MGNRKAALVAVAVTTAVLAVGAVLVAALAVFNGWYDVAATRQHWQPTYSLLEAAMRHGVRRHARDIPEPPLADEAMALRGAGCFRDKCEQCHGGPASCTG